MDIFKLFFNHDLRLDEFGEDSATEQKGTLEDFMSPTLTFSRFYLAGSSLEDQTYGLSTIAHLDSILTQLDKAFDDLHFKMASEDGLSLHRRIPYLSFEEPIVGAPENPKNLDFNFDKLKKPESGLRDIRDQIKEVLQNESILIYKEQAPNGYDLQIFSLENRYSQLFHAFKPLIGNSFRFFSINSKRINSRRKFYFEATSLDRPPHGVEEVHEDTVL